MAISEGGSLRSNAASSRVFLRRLRVAASAADTLASSASSIAYSRVIQTLLSSEMVPATETLRVNQIIASKAPNNPGRQIETQTSPNSEPMRRFMHKRVDSFGPKPIV